MNNSVLPFSDSDELITSATYLSAISTASVGKTASKTASKTVSETFTVDDVSNDAWIIGSVDGSDQPFLTAKPTDTVLPGGIPGNPAVQLDTVGNGALRLTNAEQYQVGFALLNQPLAAAQGLSISFDFFAYGGTGADGISVLLLDGSKSLPTQSGAYGGALGYAPRDSADLPAALPGLTGGYLGIGLDEFGNYSNPTEGRKGGPGFAPDAVAVRGSEANGYEYLTGSTVPFSLDNPGSETTREASLRKAQIELTADGLLTVTVQADLNQDGDFNDRNETVTPIDAYDVDAVNGALPDSFKIGFAGATGAATNIHEIRNLQINPLDDGGGDNDGNNGGNNGGGDDDGNNGGNNGGDNNDGGSLGGEQGSGCKPGRRIKGDQHDNRLKGGKNSDQIWGKDGNDRLYGRECGDYIDGGRGQDVIYGGAKRDRLKGGRGNDHLHGNLGDDQLNGGLGSDVMGGGRGQDSLRGRRGKDHLRGKQGDDALYGGRDQDWIKGGANRDLLRGNQAGDILYGQNGADTLNGGLGDDKLYGGLSHDRMQGRRGNDTLKGGAGRDTLYGGLNDDVLMGGRAADVLTGGAGSDRFVFKSVKGKGDRITDFETNEVIDLHHIFAHPRYGSANPFSDYVKLVQQGADTIVQIDANGDRALGGFKAIATLENVLAASVNVNNFAV